MKKYLKHLAGIVLLITILVAGGFSPASYQPESPYKKRVKIFMKVIEENGEKQLRVYNSYDKANKVIGDLDLFETFVRRGGKVIWKLNLGSGIKKIKEIDSENGERIIFKGKAEKISLRKAFKLNIPEDVEANDFEEYYIEYVDSDNDTTRIDPYIRIPDPPE